MEHEGFQYDFTMKELSYFLSRKKICPKCGGKLQKVKGYETRSGAELNSKADPMFVPQIKVKRYRYSFTCRECGSSFTLEELAI